MKYNCRIDGASSLVRECREFSETANLEIDKKSKQRSALQIANPVGGVFYAPKKMIIFGQGADFKSIQGSVMLP